MGLPRAMTLLVFSRGSYASAIWFQGEDGGQDTLTITTVVIGVLFQQEKEKRKEKKRGLPLGTLCYAGIFDNSCG